MVIVRSPRINGMTKSLAIHNEKKNTPKKKKLGPHLILQRGLAYRNSRRWPPRESSTTALQGRIAKKFFFLWEVRLKLLFYRVSFLFWRTSVWLRMGNQFFCIFFIFVCTCFCEWERHTLWKGSRSYKFYRQRRSGCIINVARIIELQNGTNGTK